MPRWLVASFIAFVLSCYGFVAAAQGLPAGFDSGHCKLTAVQTDPPAPNSDTLDVDSGDELADHDETGSDFTEVLTGHQPLRVPAVAAVWPPRLLPPREPSPLLDRPKRPPRAPILSI